MNNNSCVPNPFYRPAYKLLAQVSSHTLAEVVDVHLDKNTFKYLFVSANIIICHTIYSIGLLTPISKIHLNWKPHI